MGSCGRTAVRKRNHSQYPGRLRPVAWQLGVHQPTSSRRVPRVCNGVFGRSDISGGWSSMVDGRQKVRGKMGKMHCGGLMQCSGLLCDVVLCDVVLCGLMCNDSG